MVFEDKLKKEFSMFCKISGGQFNENIYLECLKENYFIRINYTDIGLSLTAGSKMTGDYEILNINNIKIIDVERLSKNNDSGELEYYILNIYLDKGLLSIRKSIRENKIIIHLKTDQIEYESSVLF
ncbi:MAG: hypothetical protein ACP5GJ_02305 [Nanopusillaceae archaeon]